MGYETAYEINHNGVGLEFNFDLESVVSEFLEFNPFINACKWYDHEEDMRSFSKKYPSVVFDLYGEGEETDDIWHKYFKNGKMQYCRAKIVFDEYDESELT